MWIEVSKVDHVKLGEESSPTSESEIMRKKIADSRISQEKRFKKIGAKCSSNSEMSSKNLLKNAQVDEKAKNILTSSAQKLDLSARAYTRIVKLARTIADIDASEKVLTNHILEALQYRPKKQSL